MGDVVQPAAAQTTNSADAGQAAAQTVVTPPAAATPPAQVSTPPADAVTPPAGEAAKPDAAAAAKPADKPSDAPVDVKYDLKLPKDSILEATRVDEIQAYAKEHKLSNDQAQALLTRENDAVASYVGRTKQYLDNQADKVWPDQVKADKELGGVDGKDFVQNMELSKRVLQKFATPELIKELNSTGYGNHPEMVRLLVRLGKGMSEDRLIQGNGSGTSPEAKSTEEMFYGSTTT